MFHPARATSGTRRPLSAHVPSKQASLSSVVRGVCQRYRRGRPRAEQVDLRLVPQRCEEGRFCCSAQARLDVLKRRGGSVKLPRGGGVVQNGHGSIRKGSSAMKRIGLIVAGCLAAGSSVVAQIKTDDHRTTDGAGNQTVRDFDIRDGSGRHCDAHATR